MPRYILTTAAPLEKSDISEILARLPVAGDATLEAVRPRLEVYGRRWWQRAYGNTYHSVRVLLDGVLVAHCPYAYGYGDCYSQTAVELLKAAGIVPNDHPAYVARRLDDLFDVIDCVEDVQRKKDL